MLEEQIYNDYVAALKAKDKHKAHFLSFIRGALKNVAIECRKEKLDDAEVLHVLQKQKKRLEESRESIISSGRQDLRDAIESEILFLEVYLPNPLEEKELIAIVDQVISEVGAGSMKDMGVVMKQVLRTVGVRADSRTVSELVKNKLMSL